jgi:hypothetical protein
MKTAEPAVKKLALKLGTWVFVSWTILLGPVGLVLLCGIACALLTSNLALGLVCGLLALGPAFLSALWVPLLVASFIAERSAQRAALPAEVDVEP